MSEYLCGLIIIGGVVAVSGLICYGGECDRTVKGALGVVLLSFIISPILTLFGSVSDIDFGGIFDYNGEDISIEDSLYYKTAEESFRVGIERLLIEELDISGDEIEAYTEGFSLAEMRADRITIILSGSGVYADYRRVINIIESEGLGECEVRLEFGGKD